ncbi:MAG TPA: NAD(P)-dependent alcohol dehydrogenase [Bryobacteraceae bacterium]|jgi:NADPH:quinone reductase-like Zn-dependent oxidoreductase|nr:NAD(P)-dependent alcohol dehydrogenase [Bryobacteraceae bacterium]
MKVYEVVKGSTSLDGLRQSQRPEPTPGWHEVLIRVRAASINYRDHMVLMGRYFTAVERETIPLSDAAGEVVSIGPGVTRFKAGDRVAGTFFQVWTDGPRSNFYPALGVPLDGVLAEYVVLKEEGVVAIPPGLSFEESATLPCAGVTAWSALMVHGRPIKPGDTVLCLGTGGVSIHALQFAKATGAKVIVTSSSDEKLARAKKLGAWSGINYKTHPEWQKEVARITGGRGVDCVVEVGGIGTLARSYESIGFGGKIALIGFLGGPTGEQTPYGLMMKGGSLFGVGVGSTAMFDDMNRAIAANGIKPVVDKVFPFEEAPEAFRQFAAGNFFGKVVITV